MTEDTSRRDDDASIGTGFGRRKFIAVGGGVGATLLAGCTADDAGSDGTPTDGSDGSGGGETAAFRLLVSDAPADIDDFDRLDVTFSEARVFEGGDGEGEEETEDGEATETEEAESAETESEETESTESEETEQDETPTDTVEEDQQQQTGEDGTATENGTATETEAGDGTETEGESETEDEASDDEGDRGFYVLDLDSPTVDLTQVVGEVAEPIFDGELEAGSYQKLELHVEDVEGIVDGEEVEVKVPSDKLQLTKPFEVRAGEELDFVFDINVVKRGNQASYNLKPVISQSGVRGEDVEVEEKGGEGDGEAGEGDDEGGAGSDDDAGSNESDDEGGAGGAGGAGGNETGGDEAGGNESAA